MYSDAVDAYNKGFAGYEKVENVDHSNPTQNCNTDIWHIQNTNEMHDKYPNIPDYFFIHDNMIEIIDGKLYFNDNKKYRIYLRGKTNLAVYYSIDGKDYQVGATIKKLYSQSSKFQINEPNTYFDVEYSENGIVTVTTYQGVEESKSYQLNPDKNGDIRNWLYVKEVLIDQTDSISLIGLGFNEWNQEQMTFPASDPQYANAYRISYEFPDNNVFETDYFYKRKYEYSYIDNSKNKKTWDEGVSLVDTNFIAINDAYTIDNLFKEGTDSSINTRTNTAEGTYFTIDMGHEIDANTITFLGNTKITQQGFPKNFVLYISTDNVKYTKLGDFVNNNVNNKNPFVDVDLGKTITFRYVNITINSLSNSAKNLILSGITFTNKFALPGNGDNVIIISSDEVVCTGSWEKTNAFSTFGFVYVGKKGSKIKFEFTGTRLGVVSSTKFGSDYVVYIDGQKVGSIELIKETAEFGITYISQKLDDKKHNVEIVCNGEANFDCFTYYTDPN